MTTIADWKEHEFLNIKIDDLRLDTPTGLYINKLMTALKKKFDAVDTELAKVQGAYVYRGTVATASDLPATGNSVGDVYNVSATGANWAWNGEAWDELGGGVKDGGGLAFDENGEMIVDFSQMPPKRIESLLAAMNLPIYIDGVNVSTEFYVNGSTGIDQIEDDYGKSPEKPWATISYAAETIAARYNINSHTVHINVASGSYIDQITLAKQNVTSGSAVIRPASANDVVTIHYEFSRANRGITHSGGEWVIQDIALELVGQEQPATNTAYVISLVSSASESGTLTLKHCPMSFTDNTLPAVSGTYKQTSLYMITVAGGSKVRLANTEENNTVDWSGNKVNANVAWMRITGGTIEPDASAVYTYNVSGAFTYFLSMSGGVYKPNGSTNLPVWNAVNSPTGKKYDVRDGGQIVTRLASVSDVADYFPGSTSGSIQSSTYSFISPTA